VQKTIYPSQKNNHHPASRVFTRVSVLALLLILAVFMAACSGAPKSQAVNTSAPATQEATTVSPTDTTTPADSPTETAASPTETAVSVPSTPSEISFANDVKPILADSCVRCHGGGRTEKGLKLDSYANLMAGSENGPVIVAGDPANSLLVQLITDGKMPKRGGPLSAEKIQIITEWVKQGAKDN
jgi:hypothetical protein